MKYRKKPVVIEAIKFEGKLSEWPIEFEQAVKSRLEKEKDGMKMIFFIETLEGPYQVKVGDWIIKGVKGEFYPCKPDIFEMTYEKVE